MYWILRYAPKNYLSMLVGALARLQVPILSRMLKVWFVGHYSVNLGDAEGTLDDYPTLGALFVRRLKPGARPLAEGIVSPVDGQLTEFGPLTGDRLLQVKGKHYSVHQLVPQPELSSRFVNGQYATFYLAPHNYHHIHMPTDGKICAMVYVPGTLWPVTHWSVHLIDDLFVINERVITILETAVGRVAVVKVGATNVGSISLVYSSLRSNDPSSLMSFRRRAVKYEEYGVAMQLNKGDLLGTFNLGSTVILLFEPGIFDFKPGLDLGPMRVGSPLGHFKNRLG